MVRFLLWLQICILVKCHSISYTALTIPFWQPARNEEFSTKWSLIVDIPIILFSFIFQFHLKSINKSFSEFVHSSMPSTREEKNMDWLHVPSLSSTQMTSDIWCSVYTKEKLWFIVSWREFFFRRFHSGNWRQTPNELIFK